MYCIQIYQYLLLPIKKRCLMKMKMLLLPSMTSSLEIATPICFSWEWPKIKGLISSNSFSSNANLYRSLSPHSKLTCPHINRSPQRQIVPGKSKRLTFPSDTRKYSSPTTSILAARWTVLVKCSAWSKDRGWWGLTLRSRISTNSCIIRLTSQTSTMSQDPEST